MGLTLHSWTDFAYRPPRTYVLGLYIGPHADFHWYIEDINALTEKYTTRSYDEWLDKCRELGVYDQIPAFVHGMMSEE